MGNTLTALNPEYWASQMQKVFYKENIAIALANTELRALLVDGDRVNKPYRSRLYAKDYTKGTDIVVEDISATNEYLDVDTVKIVPIYYDDIDKIQNKYDIVSKDAQGSQRILNNLLDQAVLAEYSNANSDVYNADVGGSGATTTIPLTTANIFSMFTAAARKLDYLNMPLASRFAVLSPRAIEVLRLSIAGRETGVGDRVGENGKIGERFGFELYQSNNCPFSATFTPTALSATDTVSIAGVTFTFSATPAAAGEVDSGANLAEALANLVLAINGTTAGSATTYVSVSNANRFKLTNAGITATEDDTTLSITGYGDIVVSDSEGDATWSAQAQHLLFGVKGATDLVVQKAPNVEIRKAEKRLGVYVYAWEMYGKKTFLDMKDALVSAHLDASSWA